MLAVKRGVLVSILFVLSLLLLMPFAVAKIEVINNFRDVYNFGETLTVDGYILAEETADGQVSLELQCPGYSKVNSVHLTINKRHMVRFAQLGIGDFVLPDTEGSCDVEIDFNGESKNSDSFTLLNDLLGAFEVAGDNEFQLGEVLQLDGIVFKLDGSYVESGDAQIFLEKRGEYPTQFGETTVTSGIVDFSKQLSNLDYGEYSIDVKVSDGMNSQYFDDVATFTVKTRFELSVSTDKYTYEPGEEVVLKGDVDGIIDGDDIDVVITFDSLRYNTVPTGGAFEYRFFVPTNMKPGSYELSVRVQDSHGNDGEETFDLTVQQVPTKIVNNVDRSSYDPGQTLSLEVQLLDQASKTMNKDVHVKITDPVGDVLYDGNVNTRQEVELTFGQYARDGTYTIVSTYKEKNLDDTDRVTVNKVRDLGSSVDGRTVYVKNTGNVDYDDRLDLVLVSEGSGEKVYYILAKDVLLDPGEQTLFDLSYDVPKGDYTVLLDKSGSVSDLDDADLAAYIDAKIDARTSDAEDVFSGVGVDDDQRAFGTRLDQGFGSVTGASTISTYDRTFTPWFFLFMVVLFGGLLGLYAYQRREVIRRRYKEYKDVRRRKKHQKESPVATIKHKDEGRGDVPQEEVNKLLANAKDKRPVVVKKVNVGTDENKRVAAIKVKHVKPGTTTLVPRTDTTAKKVVEKKHKKRPKSGVRNRFSTWNPPKNLLNDKNFPPKNPIKMEEKKEKTLYDDIDEDFLRDGKFE
jgi:hypothetical protein